MVTTVLPAQGARGAPPDADVLDASPALARRLAAVAVLAVAAAAGCYLLFVRTTLGQRFDDASYHSAVSQLPAIGSQDAYQLRHITADSFAVVLVGIVAIGVARRRPFLGLAAAFASGIAVVGTDVLKLHLLTRPALLGDGYNTFPSGHTATAVSCAMALMLVVPPRWRGVTAVFAGAYGWVTAAQVQTAGWHRPSDAIGAAFLAFASVAAVAAVVVWRRPVRVRVVRRHGAAMAILVGVAVVDGVATAYGLLDVLRYLAAHAAGQSAAVNHRAYLTGVGVTIEVVVLLLIVLLQLLGRVDIDARRPRRAR